MSTNERNFHEHGVAQPIKLKSVPKKVREELGVGDAAPKQVQYEELPCLGGCGKNVRRAPGQRVFAHKECRKNFKRKFKKQIRG